MINEFKNMGVKNFKDIVLAIILISIAILTRTYIDIGINIEAVTAVSVLSGFFFKSLKLKLLVPLIVMAISDTIIKNTSIFIFTWSAFLIAPYIGSLIKKISNRFNNVNKFFRDLVFTELGGIGFTIIFYLWTNLGVFLIGNLYPPTINGLINSYINALPFLYNQLLGNIIIVPILYIFITLYNHLYKNYIGYLYIRD